MDTLILLNQILHLALQGIPLGIGLEGSKTKPFCAWSFSLFLVLIQKECPVKQFQESGHVCFNKI